MPPKPKITRDMILSAGFEIAREAGAEGISARAVAQRLNCSTQPVMYHFSTVEELKRAVYHSCDSFHTRYLLTPQRPENGQMTEIGLNYIRFAVREPFLFKFLFQSGYVAENNLPEMINSRETAPFLARVQERAGLDPKQAKEVFFTIAMFVHGYASIIANNSMEYDEKAVKSQLERVFKGAVSAREGLK